MNETKRRTPTYINQWHTAIDKQAERALDESQPHHDRLVDAVQFASALRNFFRAVDFAVGHMTEEQRDQFQEGLAKFEEQVMDLKTVRDALEHFDEYDRKEGHAHREGDPWPFEITWENDSEGVLAVGKGISLPIAHACKMANALHHLYARVVVLG
jgi:hypothetical protein